MADLARQLADHARWWDGDPRGVRFDLTDASLPGVALAGQDLSGARLTRVRVTGDCRGIDLSRAELTDVSFVDADLSDLRAEGGTWVSVQLPRARLRRARLDGLRAVGCDLSGVDAADASAFQSTWRDTLGASSRWPRARLGRSVWTGGTLAAADFTGADLHKSVFSELDVTGARVDGADLHRVRWWPTSLATRVAGAPRAEAAPDVGVDVDAEQEFIAVLDATFGHHADDAMAWTDIRALARDGSVPVAVVIAGLDAVLHDRSGPELTELVSQRARRHPDGADAGRKWLLALRDGLVAVAASI